MVEKSKRPRGNPAHSRAASPRRALLIQAIELLIGIFYKHNHQDKQNHLKNWELEKITLLGLTSHPLHSTHSPAKDIHFSSWDREKVTNFGLTKSRSSKKPIQNHQYSNNRPKTEPELKPTPVKIKPAIQPKNSHPPPKNNPPKPVILKNEEPLDDFFKIMGY